MNWKHLGEVH